MAKAEKKRNKPSYAARMAERGREAKRLGRTLKDEPRSFPREVLRLVRRSVRTLWRARGGGLYACGFVITFLYLEIRMLIVDIVGAESAQSFITGQVMEMLFRYLGESIQNSITAFLWPIWFIQYKPPWGLAFLGMMYLVFANFLKAPLERWLLEDEPEAEDENSK